MAVSWIKIRTDIFDDEKIKLIDAMPDRDAIFVIWIKLLTLAGRCNTAGTLMLSEIMPYTDEMLAAIFARPVSVVRLGLSLFERFGMVETGDKITICNWEKHQNESGLELIREKDAQRKRIYRQKQAKKLGMSRTCLGHCGDMSKDSPSLDIDKDLEEEREREYSRAQVFPEKDDRKEEKAERPRSDDTPPWPSFSDLSPTPLATAQANATTRIETAREKWNALGLLPEARFTAMTMAPDDRSNCLRAVQAYSDAEISRSLENYEGIRKSQEHRIPAPYRSFAGFMRGGVEKFVDSAKPWDEYKEAVKDDGGVYGGYDTPEDIDRKLAEYRARKAKEG
jgi:predicted phage replisome organizer